MQTFEKEITFLSRVFDASLNDGKGDWVEQEVTKTATFKELNQKDKEQHKLHFKIISLIELFGTKSNDETDSEEKLNISSDGLYDLTVKSIKSLLVINESFTAQDKEELLADSAAIFNFGMWMMKEKFVPFFPKFKMT